MWRESVLIINKNGAPTNLLMDGQTITNAAEFETANALNSFYANIPSNTFQQKENVWTPKHQMQSETL